MSVFDAVEMPALGIRAYTFEPERRETGGGLIGGDANTYELAAPRWVFSINENVPASKAQFAAWEAFLLRLRGGQRTFLAHDPGQTRLIAFEGVPDLDSITADTTTVKADSTATYTADETVEPWGNPRITEIDSANRTITLDSFNGGATVTAGDAISWFDGRNWVLVKASATRNANASGTITALTVEPRLSAHPGVSGYALPIRARVTRACCEMKIQPQQTGASRHYTEVGSLRLSAYQIIRRS